MGRYRSRSFEVEAWRNEPGTPIPVWADREVHRGDGGTLILSTSEGIFEARIGDWILKDNEGRIFPCAGEIFYELYEPVAETPA